MKNNQLLLGYRHNKSSTNTSTIMPIYCNCRLEILFKCFHESIDLLHGILLSMYLLPGEIVGSTFLSNIFNWIPTNFIPGGPKITVCRSMRYELHFHAIISFKCIPYHSSIQFIDRTGHTHKLQTVQKLHLPVVLTVLRLNF